MKKKPGERLFNTGGGFKSKIIPIILLIVLISLVGGLTYAIWNNTYTTNVNTITSGMVSMSFTESSNVITLNNALPMSDSDGKAQTNYFDFSVTSNMTLNNGDPSEDITYNIIIEPLSVDTGYNALTSSQIKVYLENKSDSSALVTPTLISSLTDNDSNKVLLSASHNHKYGTNTVTTNYRLRAWIDMSVSANDFSTTNYEYKFRINVNGEADALEKPETAGTTIKNNNTVKTLATGFGTEIIGNDASKSGLYSFTEEGRTDYFFRGYVNNNWVKFGKETVTSCTYYGHVVTNSSGEDLTSSECNTKQDICIINNNYLTGYTLSSCANSAGTIITDVNLTYSCTEKDIYWRIYRITSTNEIRMIYAGIVAPTESTEYVDVTNTNWIGLSKYNPNSSSAEYVGYQYTEGNAHGTDNDSTIKISVDAWYNSNLKTNYEKYISTSNYCYDRTTTTDAVGGVAYTGDGASTTNAWFITSKRLLSETDFVSGGTGASLKCSSQSDKYELKVGLLGADEASIAGLQYGSDDASNYLASQSAYWTGSPFYQKKRSYVFIVSDINSLDAYTTTSNAGVRPVISLKSDLVVKSGTNGTWENPYEFVISE